MWGINRVLLGGNVGGEVNHRTIPEGDIWDFLVFSNDVTPPLGTPTEDLSLWKSRNPAILRVVTNDPQVGRRITALGKGAFVLLEGELVSWKRDGTFLMEVKLRKLLFYMSHSETTGRRREEVDDGEEAQGSATS